VAVVFSPQANRGISAAQASLKPGRYVTVALASRAKTPPLTTFTIAKATAPASSRCLKAGPDRQAQRLVTGSYSCYGIMTHGQYQQQVIHNRLGYWVLACFIETQGGCEHTRLGMERVIRIVK
jgi:hypothetical protein